MKREKFDPIFRSVADLLRLLAHPDRLRLLALLHREEMDVTHIQEAIGISQSSTSQHLKLLKLQGLVIERRDKHHIYYRLGSSLIKDVIFSIIELETHDLVNDPNARKLFSEMKVLWEKPQPLRPRAAVH